MQQFTSILEKLPYSKPFLFVDTLHHIDENGVEGSYTFPKDSFFYTGHFKQAPVTPGVILTEVMAQIGVVCLGIFLLADALTDDLSIAMTSTQIDFYKPVFPGETIIVRSTKEYFRFHKLRCKVEMLNSRGELVCRGSISGMMKPTTYA
ncbi:3-hydroxyacyl-ACP dehydratase FabZ family protein [Spirosoma linguale]|uniref:Beta-hydroxyacyl-(Acyl-carrier-protein) dehydratase FabA/FabZ n=1 Tax=Spirosoma linguale (strain ATCC 33905 / DSM 74 / LMG 10896 / Claus 1) TaxID=504472 RepID=D2QMD7_SPILD|nr:Beta-hydroxyacyl-(acyl-carrier-protein) dehydratase FabA/FabZ [Spirosoma linguale DSM 74]